MIELNSNKKTMIYIIGGSPRGGKTTLAQKLLEKTKIPYIQTDFLKFVLRPYFKGAEKEKMFPHDKRWKGLDLDKYFLNCKKKEMLNIDIFEGKIIWPGVKLFISKMKEAKVDYIIEGVHLLPSLVKYFKDDPDVKIVFLVKKNEEKIYQGLFKNKRKRDWIMDKTNNHETLRKFSQALSPYGPYFEKETAKYNFKLINTEDNFPEKINQALAYLTKK